MKLEIKNLGKKYGDVIALNEFSILLEEGVHGILGPNGAGKSTLLNILTDNVKRDSGDILCDGKEILDMGVTYRSMIGYMPQEQIGYMQFSANDFLKYMAVLKGLKAGSKEVREQIDALLRAVNLYDVRKRKIGGFSGGMKRRLLLAQALLGNPKILILDEPTAGLDPKERIAMRNMIATMASEKIIILATHIAADIECIADSVILIDRGKVIEKKAPLLLLEEVRSHIQEIICTKEEMARYQEQYVIGNIIQRKEGIALHIVREETIQYHSEEVEVSLDDVYLYYFDKEKKKRDIE